MFGDVPDLNDPVEILREKIKTMDRNKIPFCCESFKIQITRGCEEHGYDCPDYFIKIGITLPLDKPKMFWCGEAKNASYKISFCPFCGTKLPSLEKEA